MKHKTAFWENGVALNLTGEPLTIHFKYDTNVIRTV